MLKVKAACYPFNVYIQICGTKQTVLDKLKKEGIKGIDLVEVPNSAAATYDVSSNDCLIWMQNPIRTLEDLSILNHEIFHCVVRILRDCGIDLNVSTEEAYAYLTDYLCLKIYKKLGITLCSM